MSGEVVGQLAEPPSALKQSIVGFASLLSVLIVGTSVWNTVVMTVLFIPYAPCAISGGGVAVQIFGPAAVVPSVRTRSIIDL